MAHLRGRIKYVHIPFIMTMTMLTSALGRVNELSLVSGAVC